MNGSKDTGSSRESVTATPDGAAPGPDRLKLKWGTLKGWDFKTDAAVDAVAKYVSLGFSPYGAMTQKDTPDQKEALCAVIDAIDGVIINDWTGESMTKDEAKAYVLEYR